ncbi:MAG: hypothetical protein RLZZ28_723 [Bacteroidota bacterium]|jgi:hypothetical protein
MHQFNYFFSSIKILLLFLTIVFSFSSCAENKYAASDSGNWVSLFNGKNLDDWKVGANAASFRVDSGMIRVNGKTAHLFYNGAYSNHFFKNFELKASVMTFNRANSGIYIHTDFQETGWPEKGYEIQVNNSHTDWRRTGSLYGIEDVKELYVKDYEWYTEYIKVAGKRITIKINDKVVVDYTEPDNLTRTGANAKRVLSGGTIALQGHDPLSVVYFKDILIRKLPD